MYCKATGKLQRKLMRDKSFKMLDEIPLHLCTVAEARRPGLVHAFDICIVGEVGSWRAHSHLTRRDRVFASRANLP